MLIPVLGSTPASATLDSPVWVSNLLLALLLSLSAAAVAARCVLTLYRRRVLYFMSGSELAGQSLPKVLGSELSGWDGKRPLNIRVVDADMTPSGVAAELANRMRRLSRAVARIYALAGCVVCMACALAWVAVARGMTGGFLAWVVLSVLLGGFVIVTTSMVALPERWQVLSAPLPWLAVLLAGTPVVMLPGTGAFALLALAVPMVVLPTLVALVIAGPGSRAAGPVLFVPLVFALAGASLGIQGAVDLLEVAPFNESIPEALIRVCLGVGCGAGLALLGLGWIIRAYRLKVISDQEIVLATWWFCFIAAMAVFLSPSLRGGTMAFPFLWLAFVWIVHRILRTSSARRGSKPVRLLLLRVFRARRRLEGLMRGVEVFWRYGGPIYLIAGPDLASRFADPPNLMAFLRQELHRRVLSSAAHVEERLATVDDRPDQDGRYRVNEFFCSGSSWQYCVSRLVTRVDVILADFRGFETQNRGAAFELRTLMDRVPFDKLVCLVDGSTDVAALSDMVAMHWPSAAPDSPNRSVPCPTLTLVRMASSRAVASRALLGRLATAAVSAS